MQAPPPASHERLGWDVFCRVIDNHGDLGVCWRLCAQLAQAGQRVRLWCDDASALAWMAPDRRQDVQVLPWREPRDDEQPLDAVIEAFGCNPPPGFVAHMRAMPRPPVWINLEYLSAEAYVERSHGLASPQLHGPGRGLTKWFFYPGFTPATGGLLREPGLWGQQAGFDRAAFLHGIGMRPLPDERVVSLFCYDAEPLDALLSRLPRQPTLLLACPGPAQAAAMATAACRPQVRAVALSWLSQADYDHLLWSCDLNLVRGEDSLVRALWAGAPFLWQAYRQVDGAHASKLTAFLGGLLTDAPPGLAASVTASMLAWNGLQSWPAAWPDSKAWQAQCLHWRAGLAQQTDLLTQLRGFVAARRVTAAG
jgi:uncharacterized repeat protein (TIGR03837 family)